MIALQPYSSVDCRRKLTEDIKAIYFLHTNSVAVVTKTQHK